MRAEFHACPESGVPPGRGRFSYAIQAINCLATIAKSLRDKKPTQLLRSSAKLALHRSPGLLCVPAARLTRLSLVRKQPGKQFRVVKSSIPGDMSNSGIFGIARVAAGLRQVLNHRSATNDRHYRIFGAVKRPNGDMFDPIREAHIPSSTNRDGSSEILRVPYQRLPSCEAAHGYPSDINTVLVDGIFCLNHK